MSTEQRIAGDAMYAALKNLPCGCVFEHPYEPRGERKSQCARCRSLVAWQLATQERVANRCDGRKRCSLTSTVASVTD